MGNIWSRTNSEPFNDKILKEPIEVVSMNCDESGNISCLVKWEHCKELEKVVVEYIKDNFPQLIIKYYEKITVWKEDLVKPKGKKKK